MFRYFEFSRLSILDRLQIYQLVCRNFEGYNLTFENFQRKHHGYCGSSFGYLYIDKSDQIRAWRAYLPMLLDDSHIVHLAGVDACVDQEHRGSGVLNKLTAMSSECLNFPCIVYGYPNALNNSYDRAEFTHISNYRPKILFHLDNHNGTESDRLNSSVTKFKATFLNSISVNSSILFQHPTRKYALIHHGGNIHTWTSIRASISMKIIITFQPTCKKSNLRQVAKSFHCDLKEHIMLGTYLCDFL